MGQLYDGGGASPPPPSVHSAPARIGLARANRPELLWHAHLDYLCDLQRVAREVLAHVG